MTELRFYHLQKTSIYDALPVIVSKAYGTGKNVIIRTGQESVIKKLDEELWSFSSSSFIPHGTKKDKNPEDQAVYITDGMENPNKAEILFLVMGANEENIESFDLVCEVFNGADNDELIAARAKWKEHKDSEIKLTYWQQQDDGSWVNKA